MDFVKNTFSEDASDESEKPVKPDPSQPIPPTVPAVPAKTAASPPRPVDQERAASLDAAARAELAPALAASKFQREISETMDLLKEDLPDEEARFKAAVKMIVRKGPTMVDLIGDIDSCVGVLQEKGREFREVLESQIDQKVGAKKRKMKETDDLIAAKHLQIETLSKEIQELTGQRNDIYAAINDGQREIDEVKERFEVVYKSVQDELAAKKAKLSKLKV
jgi:chromosome segregation ATPase